MMEEDLERLREGGSIVAFISHTAHDGVFANELSNALREYGIEAFVAHDDIEPMREWVGEIENALSRMDLLIALFTPQFNASDWADQEVGVAIGRSVPVVPVHLGRAPYGFLGRYQAVREAGGAREIAARVFEFALGNENLAERAVDGYIAALRSSRSFAISNHLASQMANILALTPDQESALVHAFNANYQVYRARNIRAHIIGLLKRTTGNAYEIAGDRLRRLP